MSNEQLQTHQPPHQLPSPRQRKKTIHSLNVFSARQVFRDNFQLFTQYLEAVLALLQSLLPTPLTTEHRSTPTTENPLTVHRLLHTDPVDIPHLPKENFGWSHQMASQSTYLTYKRETAELLYWIIKASNSIIQKTGAADRGGLSLLNTTGKTTVQGLLSMTKLIAQHIGEQTVPPVVYRLFRSVIKARETTHRFFLQLAAEKFDPEIEKSNESHQHFISVLYEAFKALGGDLEPLGTETDVGPSPRAAPIKRGHPDSTTETPENNNVILLANKFASLYLGTADDDKEEEEGGNASDATSAAASIQKSQKKSHGKRKKGVRGRKSTQKKNSTKPDVKESTLDGIPIESYRIIEDEEGVMTDYLIATYSLTFEWMSLRSYLQDTWYEVAYDGLNSAVAGALSNVAISMLKRSELAMHVDFPGHDTFHTVVNTITRGGMGDTQENLKLPKFQLLEHAAHQVEETTLDVKEQFMIYAYNDLLDFLGDFQKKRNGRPTKSMLADIDDWDPSLDLQQATPKERLKWRRCYTINWLYDLVNVFSVAAVHERARNGQEWTPEQVDWSTNGTWNHFRRIFGLREFAREVTSLAMQKQGTDTRNKIQPHMVFQLQCIVDSFMVSRGFSTDIRNGQVLSPPAHHFRPRRDVDAFLDRGGESMGNGFIPSFIRLGIEVEGNISMNRCPDASGYAYCIETLTHLENAFHHWLGITCYASGFEHLPPSRFSKTNENGLWEYSPFTCGVGLVEGLELAYQHGLMVLDQAAEPLLLGHLHNMLLQKGYIDQPLGLFWKLQHIFPDAFFNDSKVPISNYQSAMKAKILLIKPSHNRSRFLAKMRENVGVDLQERYGVGSNSRFKNPSLLTLYRKAAWNHERIPDSDIDFFSRLATLRLNETDVVKDPKTGKWRRAETELTSHLGGIKLDEEYIMSVAQNSRQMPGIKAINKARASSKLPELSQNLKTNDRAEYKTNVEDVQHELSSIPVLDYLRSDIEIDICSPGGTLSSPRSGINFVYILNFMLCYFSEIEDELDQARNPTYVQVYEVNPTLMEHKRVNLIHQALKGEDEECLQIMAECFERRRAWYEDFFYWNRYCNCGKHNHGLESAMHEGNEP